MIRRVMLAATIALGLWGFGGTDIAHGLVIVSPRSGETFLEGQSVKVVAEFSPDDPDDLVDIGFVITENLGNCSKEILSLPLECSFTIPSGSPRRIEIAVMGARATVEDAVSSPTVTISVGLPPTVTLQGLTSGLGTDYFFSMLGQNKQLYISGRYSDGVDREIEGTTYVSSDEQVVVVNAKGLATAMAPGTTKITVTNGPHKLVIDVEVKDIVKPRIKPGVSP